MEDRNSIMQGTMNGFGLEVGDKELEKREAEFACIQEALRDSNEFLISMIETVPSAVIALDREMNVLTWNPAAEKIFGWTAAEVLGGFLPQVPVEKRAETKAIHQKALEGNLPSYAEVQRFRKDGSPITVSVLASLLRDKEGQVKGTLAIMNDITEQKKLEAVLLKEKERFQSLVEKSPLGVAIIHPDGRYQYINPAFKDIFGYDLEDIPTGKAWFEKAYPDPEYRQMVVSHYKTFIIE